MSHLHFENVTLDFPIYNTRSLSLRHKLIALTTGGSFIGDGAKHITIRALDNVSFSIKDGDTIGLIGHNGAGKTTLLRTMAGIYSPTSGLVRRQGRVSTIIELGAGLEAELSGHDNILRMGQLYGCSLPEIKILSKKIADFTELGDFLNLPVRTYSAGMVLRLMFAVATAREPDILLVDEIIGTGDSSFYSKTEKHLKNFIKSANVFVFASHNEALLREYCKKIFRLEKGKVIEISNG